MHIHAVIIVYTVQPENLAKIKFVD